MTAASRPAGRSGQGLAGAWGRFWYSEEPDLRRLALFRIGFFAVVALDAWGMVGNAAPFSESFNVPHWPVWLDWIPVPSLSALVALRLVQFFLAMRMMLGVGGRLTAALLAASFAYTYFCSQLDNYQHRYLVLILLVACSLVDWKTPRRSGWVVRLILVQMSLVYFWTAVTKMDATWLEGRMVQRLAGPELFGMLELAAAKLGLSIGTLFALASWSVLVIELLLAVGFQVKAWRGAVWLTGMFLHGSFLLGNLSIGYFTWYLFAIYFLVLPAPLLDLPKRWGFGWSIVEASARRASSIRHWLCDDARRGRLLFAAALGLGLLAFFALPVPGAAAAAVAVLGLALLLDLSRRGALGTRAVAHLVMVLVLIGLHAGTDRAQRLARRLADDARKLNLPAEVQLARQEQLVLQAPGETVERRLLASQLREAGRHGEAARHLEDVARREPEVLTTWTELATALLADGQASRAATAYAKAVDLDPGSADLLVLHGVAKAAAADQLDDRPELQPEAEELREEAVELFARGGRIHEDASNWRLAADAFARAQLLDPERVSFMVRLAVVNRNQGRTEQALSWVERALEVEPRNSKARELRQSLLAE